MKNWITAALGVVLVLTMVFAGFSYVKLNRQINDAKSQITGLRLEISSMQTGSAPDSSPKPSSTPASTAPPSGSSTMTMGDIISLIRPVIVRVDVTGLAFQAYGSGIIIRSDGYVITNQHVIDSATSISVLLNSGQRYPATVSNSDTNLDLAILQLTGSPTDLPVATLGAASDIVIGGVVLAAGYPLGPDLPGPASFTQGIVSAVRTLNGNSYIQSDVQINPGNSGGALVARTTGIVIGVTTSKVLPQGQDIEGIGLAIPVDVFQTYIRTNLKP
jgi:serine protease Do